MDLISTACQQRGLGPKEAWPEGVLGAGRLGRSGSSTTGDLAGGRLGPQEAWQEGVRDPRRRGRRASWTTGDLAAGGRAAADFAAAAAAAY